MRLNRSVIISDFRGDALLFKMRDCRTEVDRRQFVPPLPFVGSKVEAFFAPRAFEIPITNLRPCAAPDFRFPTVVPIDRVFLMAFPFAGRKFDPLPIFVQIVNLTSLRKELSVFIERAWSA